MVNLLLDYQNMLNKLSVSPIKYELNNDYVLFQNDCNTDVLSYIFDRGIKNFTVFYDNTRRYNQSFNYKYF